MVTCMNEVFANKYLCDAHCPVCLTLALLFMCRPNQHCNTGRERLIRTRLIRSST